MAYEKKIKTKKVTYSVYIVDDHPTIRRGLTEYITSTKKYKVCGRSDNINKCINDLPKTDPNIILIDLSLKNENGFSLIEEIKNKYTHIKIVVFSMHEDIFHIEKSFRLGAHGYVTKSEPEENLIHAFESVLNNELFIIETTKSKLLERLLSSEVSHNTDAIKNLTHREFDVFQKIADGNSIKHIAKKLHLSINTIQTYRDRIKTKLGIEKTHDLNYFAFQWKTQNPHKTTSIKILHVDKNTTK